MAENDLFFHKKLPKCDKKNLFAYELPSFKKKFNLIVIFNRIGSKKNIYYQKKSNHLTRNFTKERFVSCSFRFYLCFLNLFFGLCMKIIPM